MYTMYTIYTMYTRKYQTFTYYKYKIKWLRVLCRETSDKRVDQIIKRAKELKDMISREMRNVLYAFQRDIGGKFTEDEYVIGGIKVNLDNVKECEKNKKIRHSRFTEDPADFIVRHEITASLVLNIWGYDEWECYRREVFSDREWALNVYYKKIRNYFKEKGVKSLLDEEYENYF